MEQVFRVFSRISFQPSAVLGRYLCPSIRQMIVIRIGTHTITVMEETASEPKDSTAPSQSARGPAVRAMGMMHPKNMVREEPPVRRVSPRGWI